MKFSKYNTYTLVALLIILNIIFRYPTTPHQIGWDSFTINLLANSISEFGYAKWWIHPASIGGFYPYSYASVVPFFLSGISQCTGIGMQCVIWIFGVLIGIFSASTAYLMAGAIKDDDVFKYVVALVYSTSTGILYFTTWTVSTRGLFIVLLPLFIYLLLKCRISIAKYSILTLILFVVLLITHHLFYYIIPIVVTYPLAIIFYKLNIYVRFDKIPKNVVNFALLACFLGMFAITLFRTPGSISQFDEYVRMIGFPVIFMIGGFSYILLKPVKSFEEWFLLIVLLGLIPMLHIEIYTKWFFLVFAFLLIGVAITNVATVGMQEQTHITKRKYATTFVVFLLLFSTIFAGYYQYLHFLNDPGPSFRYMEDKAYIGALWMKDAIDKDKNMVATTGYRDHRVYSISEVPMLTGIGVVDLAYGFVDPDKLEVKQSCSYLSTGFYLHSPYSLVNHKKTIWYVGTMSKNDINDHSSWAYRITSRFNLSYCMEDMSYPTTFTRSLQQTKNNLYDNGKIRVWCLD